MRFQSHPRCPMANSPVGCNAVAIVVVACVKHISRSDSTALELRVRLSVVEPPPAKGLPT